MSVSGTECLGLAVALGLGSESPNPTHSSNVSETLNPKLDDLNLEENQEKKLDGWDQDFTAYGQNDEKNLESLTEVKHTEENGEKWGWDDDVGAFGENAEFENGFLKEEKWQKSDYLFPVKPDEPNCAYYTKTGTCKYGLNCKFNHPADKTRNKANFRKGLDPVQVVEYNGNGTSSAAVGQTDYEKAYKENRRGTLPDRNVQIDCKFYSMPGGCKYGNACKYVHKEQTEVPVELNFLGLPMRPGEKECTYYMSTGSCKYSTNCRFHHPNPTAVGVHGSSGYQHGGSPQPYVSPARPPVRPTVTPWPLQQIPIAPVPYLDPTPSYATGFFLPQGLHPNSESNGYPAPVNPFYPAKMNMPQPSPATPMEDTRKSNDSAQKQSSDGEYPQRPGQPECQFFMKTRACKFKSACKYHHPKSRLPKTSDVALSPVGLPLRPDQPECAHFSRHGICKKKDQKMMMQEEGSEDETVEMEVVPDIDYVFKVVVVGDSAVGKSQILGRFTRGEFCFDSKSTIGVEFQTRTITINRKRIKAQIWDTAGQERYQAVTRGYYRGALGAMLVYNITERQTFDHVVRWLEELRAHADNSLVIMLLGNKADLTTQRDVSVEDATEFAEDQGLFFSEASALTGENVETAFLMLIEEIHKVVSRKALEREEGKGRNDLDNVVMLKGTNPEVSLMETSALKKASSCNCS